MGSEPRFWELSAWGEPGQCQQSCYKSPIHLRPPWSQTLLPSADDCVHAVRFQANRHIWRCFHTSTWFEERHAEIAASGYCYVLMQYQPRNPLPALLCLSPLLASGFALPTQLAALGGTAGDAELAAAGRARSRRAGSATSLMGRCLGGEADRGAWKLRHEVSSEGSHCPESSAGGRRSTHLTPCL